MICFIPPSNKQISSNWGPNKRSEERFKKIRILGITGSNIGFETLAQGYHPERRIAGRENFLTLLNSHQLDHGDNASNHGLKSLNRKCRAYGR
jgi:hypothetical protein